MKAQTITTTPVSQIAQTLLNPFKRFSEGLKAVNASSDYYASVGNNNCVSWKTQRAIDIKLKEAKITEIHKKIIEDKTNALKLKLETKIAKYVSRGGSPDLMTEMVFDIAREKAEDKAQTDKENDQKYVSRAEVEGIVKGVLSKRRRNMLIIGAIFTAGTAVVFGIEDVIGYFVDAGYEEAVEINEEVMAELAEQDPAWYNAHANMELWMDEKLQEKLMEMQTSSHDGFHTTIESDTYQTIANSASGAAFVGQAAGAVVYDKHAKVVVKKDD